MPVFELNGESIRYRVRHSQRAKRVIIKFSPVAGLEIVYPHGPQAPPPDEVLHTKAKWLAATLRRYQDAGLPLGGKSYDEGEEFLLRGKPLRLRLVVADTAAETNVVAEEDTLLLSAPADLPSLDRDWRRNAVIDFYRRLARGYLPIRAAALAAEHGFAINTVRVKNQKTRWGSCSAKGNINLNMRLMMAPEAAIDYVIIHELCHLRVLNHSDEFWTLVESLSPDYREWRAWFKQNQARLIL